MNAHALTDPNHIRTASDVVRLADEVLGPGWDEHDGVLHITSAARGDGGSLAALRITEHTPRSAHDRFLLWLSRARTDAVIVTGKILRDEPHLTYSLPDDAMGRALAEYRKTIAKRREPPWLVIMSGGNVPLDHPALTGWARPVILTGAVGAAHLERRLSSNGVRITPLAQPSIEAALAFSTDELGARRIAIEAGPSTVCPLYEGGQIVDELWLSAIDDESAPREVIGGRLPSEIAIARAMDVRYRTVIDEPTGRWTFSRWARRR